jgi:hypothetical protein
MKLRTQILAVAVTALAACGASNVATERLAPPTNLPTVNVPNLNDPGTRHRFVCRFAPGSFGTPPATLTSGPGCEDLSTTGP